MEETTQNRKRQGKNTGTCNDRYSVQEFIEEKGGNEIKMDLQSPLLSGDRRKNCIRVQGVGVKKMPWDSPSMETGLPLFGDAVVVECTHRQRVGLDDLIGPLQLNDSKEEKFKKSF